MTASELLFVLIGVGCGWMLCMVVLMLEERQKAKEAHVPPKVPFPAPWKPIADPRALKRLGKLGEECGELSTVVSRCVIQGMAGINPKTGQLNTEWLEDEIADVTANIGMCISHFGLNSGRISQRVKAKIEHLTLWHFQE